MLFVRQGKLTGNQAYSFEDFELPDEEVLDALLTQFYQGERYVPDEILRAGRARGPRGARRVPERAQGASASRSCGRSAATRCACSRWRAENAAQSFRERQDAERQHERMSEELQRKLHLRNAPKRIECFDISNIQGGWRSARW